METIWADENGNFTLADGSSGNPGCDCGMADAVVRVDGEYLCASEAKARGINKEQE
jgi:hypothetical protein